MLPPMKGAKTKTLAICAALVLIAIVLISLRNRPARPGAVSTSAPASRKVVPADEVYDVPGRIEFHDGSVLEVVGMHESPSGQVWWGIDGEAVPPDPTYSQANSRRPTTDASLRVVDLRYHVHAESALRFRWFYYDFPGYCSEMGWEMDATDRHGTLAIALPPDMTRGDVRIGQALGSFTTVVTADVELSPGAAPKLTIRPTKTLSAVATTQAAKVTFGDVVADDAGMLRIQFIDFRSPKERTTTAAELAAISKSGTRTVITDSLHRQHPNPMIFTVSSANLRSVVYLTRGIEWHTLKNVAFRPTTTQPTTVPAL